MFITIFNSSFSANYCNIVSSTFIRAKPSRSITSVMLFTAIWIFAFEHSIRKSSRFFLLLNGIFMRLTIFLMSSHSSNFIEWPAAFTYKFLFFHICSLYYSDVGASLFLFTLNILQNQICWRQPWVWFCSKNSKARLRFRIKNSLHKFAVCAFKNQIGGGRGFRSPVSFRYFRFQGGRICQFCHPSVQTWKLVAEAGFEPATSGVWTRQASNCSIPQSGNAFWTFCTQYSTASLSSAVYFSERRSQPNTLFRVAATTYSICLYYTIKIFNSNALWRAGLFP